MSRFQFFAVEPDGPRLLPVPEGAAQFIDLYRDLQLGVYTALRTFDHNRFLGLADHLDRTERSMGLLGWEYRLDRQRLCRQLDAVVTAAAPGEMRVRIDVLAEPAWPLGTESRELIALQPFAPPSAELYRRGVAVAFAEGLARENPLVKAADFAARRPASGGLKQLEATATAGGAPEPYEFLLVSDDGRILEGTGTNFWGIRDGVIYTAGEGVLEGITRKILLDLIAAEAIPLRLEAVRVDEIGGLDEAALSGSSRAFLPVVNIAGQTIGSGVPGPLSKHVLEAYEDYLATHIRRACD